MNNPEPTKVNKLAIVGATLSLIGLVLSLLSIAFYANFFSSNQKPSTETSNLPTSTTSEVNSGFNIADFYQKVEKGQTRAVVISSTSEQPNCAGKNVVEGYGEIEYCTWSKVANDKYESVTVTFVNAIVDGKSKVGL
jgi:hypothetical protein